MSAQFISKVVPPEAVDGPALWFVFCENKLLIPVPELTDIQEWNPTILHKQYLGVWQQRHCYALEISSLENLPDTFMWQPLRQAALNHLDQSYFHLASRALQILQWDKNHQFCGRCGSALKTSETERAKLCASCNISYYPRISPCVIVLIKRGKEILLARSPHFSPGVYSTLAGFIEPGESAEEALEREVMEEVGIKIKNIQYRFSQPWPFPDSLMLGFTAEHAAGEIVIDGQEIEDAGWFTLDNLPELPITVSISRKLIELFIKQEF